MTERSGRGAGRPGGTGTRPDAGTVAGGGGATRPTTGQETT
ncbi:hypothetical protein V6U77_07355 [Micromonospora sp. CPCC 205546]